MHDSIFSPKLEMEQEIVQPNPDTLEAIEDVNLQRNLIGPFDSVAEVMDYLNAED